MYSSNSNTNRPINGIMSDPQLMQADDPNVALTEDRNLNNITINNNNNKQIETNVDLATINSNGANIDNQMILSNVGPDQHYPGQQSLAVHNNHRMKIGSVQSVWVPTEDVLCNCPKLELQKTYLIMGLVDAKENSPTSIQLDRHGVVLEWRSSLQEKLIKYQKRQSKGRC